MRQMRLRLAAGAGDATRCRSVPTPTDGSVTNDWRAGEAEAGAPPAPAGLLAEAL